MGNRFDESSGEEMLLEMSTGNTAVDSRLLVVGTDSRVSILRALCVVRVKVFLGDCVVVVVVLSEGRRGMRCCTAGG